MGTNLVQVFGAIGIYAKNMIAHGLCVGRRSDQGGFNAVGVMIKVGSGRPE